MSSRLGPDLEQLLGTAAFVALAEAFGGTRLYIPTKMTVRHEIAAAIGLEQAQKLSRRLAPDVIAVPLAREQRALHYRRHNLSNGQIASRLGMTESGVNRLFARMDEVPVKGSAGSALPLFPEA